MPRASDFGGWHSSAYSPESEVGGLNQPRRSASHVGQSPGEATRSPNERSHTAKQSYCRGENHAVFRVATFDVSARLETAKFPAWEEIVPKKSKHELRVSKTDLLEALDRVAAAIGDRSRGVVLHRTGERLEIHGENPNAGELKTEIAASGWADKAVIEVNLGYLHNAARFAPSDELRIGLTDDASPLKIHEGPYLAVVMPLRLEKGDMP